MGLPAHKLDEFPDVLGREPELMDDVYIPKHRGEPIDEEGEEVPEPETRLTTTSGAQTGGADETGPSERRRETAAGAGHAGPFGRMKRLGSTAVEKVVDVYCRTTGAAELDALDKAAVAAPVVAAIAIGAFNIWGPDLRQPEADWKPPAPVKLVARHGEHLDDLIARYERHHYHMSRAEAQAQAQFIVGSVSFMVTTDKAGNVPVDTLHKLAPGQVVYAPTFLLAPPPDTDIIMNP